MPTSTTDKIRKLATTVCVTALLAVTSCAAPDEPENQDSASRLAQIKERGELVACTTGDYPPFTVQENEEDDFEGIDIEMVRDLAETMDVELRIEKSSWGSLMDDFLQKCDIAVGGISMNPERAEQVFFTEPILEDGKTPITRCENVDKYKTIDDINQPSVTSIFLEGGTNEKFARANYPEGELVTHDNLTIFDQLVDKKADVMTTDRAEALYIAHEYDELCVVHENETFDYSVMGYMLPQSDMVFKEYVDQWLQIALNDGTYDEISKEWVGDIDLNG
ncbi:transporter substrate-binding domain-containing protein [Micrococcoides hystricis]|uniref:Transporter substrate-binding domain-containing protein n=1 Tax=Micrococcoides hystricis TaxID=1572761 RepID=A0ABV6PBP8_9MICC